MTGPDDPRARDEIVEPLFAGLADADRRQGEPATPTVPEDAWHRGARVRLDPANPLTNEPEPSTWALGLKALFLILALIAAGAFVYFAFGV